LQRWWTMWKSTLQPLGQRSQGRHRKVPDDMSSLLPFWTLRICRDNHLLPRLVLQCFTFGAWNIATTAGPNPKCDMQSTLEFHCVHATVHE
jgi:hypothetical protein